MSNHVWSLLHGRRSYCLRCDIDYDDYAEATIAELREAAREAVDAVRFQKPEHERAAIDALAELLEKDDE